MLKLQNVSFDYALSRGEVKHVLYDLSFSVSQNEVVGILGPSGCGKSTLLRCIAGLLEPSTGSIIINSNSPRNAQRKKEIGFAFQEPFLLNWLNVEANISLGDCVGVKSDSLADSDSKINYFLNLIGLEEAKYLYPHQLSGGMKQRVSFARALYTNPKLLLLDEPFSAVDVLTKTKLVIELSKTLSSVHTPTVIVTHHIEEAVLLSDRIFILSKAPSTIIKEVDISIEKPRNLSDIETPKFREIVKECRNLLFQSIEL